VTYPQTAQTSLAAIEQIPIRATNGSVVRVGDIATLMQAAAPSMITRINRQTVVGDTVVGMTFALLLSCSCIC
jgi:multidrug efflux pump subunit AcrB